MKILKLLLLQVLLSAEQSPVRDHTSFPAHVQERNGTCPTQQDRQIIRNQILHNISSILQLSTCGGTPGWRRVGYLDMTDPSQSCPPGLDLKYYSPGLRSCGRVTNTTAACFSTFYSTGDTQYSRVCGRVRGYQFSATSALQAATQGIGIDGPYVDGVSLTHGQSGSRTHIWTFVAGIAEGFSSQFTNEYCPCASSAVPPPPTFIGDDYFCESGINGAWNYQYIFYPADPLWNGQNCITASCCQLNNPPYFTKTLPVPTTDDIELRICVDGHAIWTDIPIDQVELYVK